MKGVFVPAGSVWRDRRGNQLTVTEVGDRAARVTQDGFAFSLMLSEFVKYVLVARPSLRAVAA